MFCFGPAELPPSEPPISALVSMEKSPYGFSLVDLGLSEEDFAIFDALVIVQNHDFHHFGNLTNLEKELSCFYPLEITMKVAAIARQILEASGKEVGWLWLRASIPSTDFDIPRWHIDGQYYGPSNVLQYRFVTTLVGPSTIFYPIDQRCKELRRVFWKSMPDRKFGDQLCCLDHKVIPKRGEGVFFIGGDYRKGAVHSEPPFHENRLLFSLIPCSLEELPVLKSKIEMLYRFLSD